MKKKKSGKRAEKVSRIFGRKPFKGAIGLGVVFVLLLVGIFGVFLVGGIDPQVEDPTGQPIEGTVITPVTSSHDNLQLYTFKLKECASTVAIEFLVDNSGSMDFATPYGTKMSNLKNALTEFANAYPASGILGLTKFSGPNQGVANTNPPVPPLPPTELVPMSTFSTVKSQFINQIANMQALGETDTKEAFNYVLPIMSKAKIAYPQQKLALVMISDGIPETGQNNLLKSQNSNVCPFVNTPLCEQNPQGPGCRCFDNSQDPTSVATQIKNMGVRIFTIIYVAEEDQKFRQPLTDLMKNVASSPNDFYEAPVESSQFTSILQQITTKFCI
jgi:hypothetical protein